MPWTAENSDRGHVEKNYGRYSTCNQSEWPFIWMQFNHLSPGYSLTGLEVSHEQTRKWLDIDARSLCSVSLWRGFDRSCLSLTLRSALHLLSNWKLICSHTEERHTIRQLNVSFHYRDPLLHPTPSLWASGKLTQESLQQALAFYFS